MRNCWGGWLVDISDGGWGMAMFWKSSIAWERLGDNLIEMKWRARS